MHLCALHWRQLRCAVRATRGFERDRAQAKWTLARRGSLFLLWPQVVKAISQSIHWLHNEEVDDQSEEEKANNGI